MNACHTINWTQEQNNQDIVSLGTHAALTAADACALLKNAVAIHLLAAAQAVDLRRGAEQLGAGTRPLHSAVRAVSAPLVADRALDVDIAAVVAAIDARTLPAVTVELDA